ncbi:unnamed protein product, partial [Owenia fusiformis]
WWAIIEMSGDLRSLLATLHSCLEEGNNPSDNERVQLAADDIRTILTVDSNAKETDHNLSVLFDATTGVIPFLRSAIQFEVVEYANAKKCLLETLSVLIEHVGKKILPYTVDIKDVCISLFTRDKSNKVKADSLPLLTRVMEVTMGTKMEAELDVAKLILRFFNELAKPESKQVQMVRRNIYALLGMICEVYPSEMIKYNEKLLRIYLQTLNQEMKTSKTVKWGVIAGCMEGLVSYLVNFTQSASEGSKHAYDIYKVVRQILNKANVYSKYDHLRAALNLITKHAGQFNEYLYEDHKQIHDYLVFWSAHHNRDVHYLGISALEAFLKQLSDMLVAKASDGERDGATFKFFIQKFREVMDNPNSTGKEVSIATRGYGFFAAPCRIFLSEEDVKFMFNEMIQRSEQIYFSNNEVIDEKIQSLPTFLESLASIVNEMSEISDIFLVSLVKLVVVLIEHCPNFSKAQQFICPIAILKVLFALNTKGPTLRKFLSQIVYQGLIRTCSHPVAIVTDERTDTGAESVEEQHKVTYKDYIELWRILLQSAKLKELASIGISLSERDAMTRAIYDELISAILRMLHKLDLSSNKVTEIQNTLEEPVAGPSDRAATPSPSEEMSSDPAHGLQARKPKDFQIFINLVDFTRDMLPEKQCELFTSWVLVFGQDIIILSTKQPLVSGLYKLLSVCMTIASKTHYFKGVNSNETHVEDDNMEVDVYEHNATVFQGLNFNETHGEDDSMEVDVYEHNATVFQGVNSSETHEEDDSMEVDVYEQSVSVFQGVNSNETHVGEDDSMEVDVYEQSVSVFQGVNSSETHEEDDSMEVDVYEHNVSVFQGVNSNETHVGEDDSMEVDVYEHNATVFQGVNSSETHEEDDSMEVDVYELNVPVFQGVNSNETHVGEEDSMEVDVYEHNVSVFQGVNSNETHVREDDSMEVDVYEHNATVFQGVNSSETHEEDDSMEVDVYEHNATVFQGLNSSETHGEDDSMEVDVYEHNVSVFQGVNSSETHVGEDDSMEVDVYEQNATVFQGVNSSETHEEDDSMEVDVYEHNVSVFQGVNSNETHVGEDDSMEVDVYEHNVSVFQGVNSNETHVGEDDSMEVDVYEHNATVFQGVNSSETHEEDDSIEVDVYEHNVSVFQGVNSSETHVGEDDIMEVDVYEQNATVFQGLNSSETHVGEDDSMEGVNSNETHVGEDDSMEVDVYEHNATVFQGVNSSETHVGEDDSMEVGVYEQSASVFQGVNSSETHGEDDSMEVDIYEHNATVFQGVNSSKTHVGENDSMEVDVYEQSVSVFQGVNSNEMHVGEDDSMEVDVYEQSASVFQGVNSSETHGEDDSMEVDVYEHNATVFQGVNSSKTHVGEDDSMEVDVYEQSASVFQGVNSSETHVGEDDIM